MISPKFSLIFILSIQILYLLHHPPSTEAGKKKAGPKLTNLALVLFKSADSTYSFPRCYRQDLEGKIRDFKAADGSEPMFFCPNPGSESKKKFLYLTSADNYSCENAPDPTIRKITKEDGSDRCAGTGDLYSYGYNLSEKPFDKEYTSDQWQEIYSFCYVEEESQIVYLRYRIISPNLLTNRQLIRERSYYENEYRLEEIEDVALKAYLEALMNFNKDVEDPIFTKMELGHPADLIFPNWRKPFYSAANHGLILRVIKNYWKKIGRDVRKLAQKKLGEIEILTGTLKYPDTGKLFGTWWKLVIYKKKAMAIILHNVYIDPTKKNTTTQENLAIQETNTPEELQQPNKDTTVVPGQSSASQTTPSQVFEYPTDYELLCTDICKQYGFRGFSSKYKVIAYCCDPKVITDLLKLPPYEILDLKQIQKDEFIEDDGCPKDPIKVPDSQDGKLREGGDKTAAV